MSDVAKKSDGPAWLRDAEEQYRRRRDFDQELILQVCRMGREDAQLSEGERNYLMVHWRRYRETIRQLPDVSSGRLLDVGCFPGHLALLAHVKGWEVSGVSLPGQSWGDPDFENRMRAAGIGVTHVDIQRQAFPFDDESFDAAFFNETIEHLALNPFQPLDEIWRILRPGGLMVFSVPNLSRFDMRLAMLRGATIHLALDESLAETFPADIGNRHIREYTADEVRYFLTSQDKYLYRFDIERLIMDRSWDGVFCRADGVVREWRRITKATLLREISTRFMKSLRGNIIVRARRPDTLVPLQADAIKADGFFPDEETGVGTGFVRLPIRASWMRKTARIALRVPRGFVRHADLLALLPAPASVGMKQVSVRTPHGAHEFQVQSTAEPQRIRIPLNVTAENETEIPLQLETGTWRPADHGIPQDERELGVMICLERVLVETERIPE